MKDPRTKLGTQSELRALLDGLDLRTAVTYLAAWIALSVIVLAIIIVIKGP
jgi:hypothetical protein